MHACVRACKRVRVYYQARRAVLRQVRTHAGSSSIPCILVGNKSDLEQARGVPTELGREFAEK
jgi:hypothetical protein